jgi:TDG/mug DNA glycosylase family protein
VESGPEVYPFRTLPDYLAPDLELVFVGINPGLYAVQQGHYFARRTNRFWPAFSRSHLSAPIRSALRRDELRREDDSALLVFGIGFTDVVKLPSRNASDLLPVHFQQWAPRLLARLERYHPRVACFHGVTAFGNFAVHGLAERKAKWELGPQTRTAGRTRLFVVPNPSPANAHFTPSDQTVWYDRLAEFLQEVARASLA